MASVLLSPKFREFVPGTGTPAVAFQVQTYAAGTTTPLATYSDAALSVPNANPVVLDSNGQAVMYGAAGALYKIVFLTSVALGSTTIYTVDNVTLYGGGAAPSTTTQWIASGLVPTFISSTSFSVPGDQHLIFAIGTELQTTNTGGTIYSQVVSSSFGAGITTVTVINHSGVLDSGLSVVNIPIITAANSAVPTRSSTNFNVTHGTETLSTGTQLVLSTTNLVTIGSLVDGSLSEWSSSTGNFTPKRSGNYLLIADARITSTGVTFNGTTVVSITTNSGGTVLANVDLTSGVAASNRVAGTVAAIFNTSSMVGAFQFAIQCTFSAGTPQISIIYCSIIGPL